MRRVSQHVRETGHRTLYSTVWPSEGRVGFSCATCEDEHLVWTTWANQRDLPVNSCVWEYVGANNHAKLVAFLDGIDVPDAWQVLLKESPLDD